MQLSVEQRMKRGVSVMLGNTWAHAIDNVPLEFGGGAAGPLPQDPRNLVNEKGNSIIDIRHRLTLSYLWELPFGKGRTWLNHGGPVDWILGDASAPSLDHASVDVVLCRHVLWALPDPAEVVARWVRLLRPAGRLVLVEGFWHTGAGLHHPRRVRSDPGEVRQARPRGLAQRRSASFRRSRGAMRHHTG